MWRITILFFFGVLLVCEPAWGARSSGLRRRLRAIDDDAPQCNCDCCDVVPRLPDEVFSGVAIKCSTSSKHDPQLCPSECTTVGQDSVLQTAQGELVDYLRFCFFECKPPDGLQTPIDSQCAALEATDVEKLVDKSGNARDPAVLLIPPPKPLKKKQPTASLLRAGSSTTSTESGRRTTRIDPAAARVKAEQGMKQAKMEGQGARDTAAVVRAGQEARASRISGQLGAPNPYASVADIHAAMLGAMKSAGAAGEFAQEAAAAVEQARAGDWQASIEQGKAAMAGVKGQADAKDAAAAAAMKAVTNSNELVAAAAAAKASEPYFLSMLRAQQAVKDYTGKGGGMAKKATALESKAKGLEKKANQQNAAGAAASAQATIINAREVMQEAQDYAKQAHQMFAVAEEINKGIPKYQAAAQAAAARAAWASNPAWNPGATR